MMIHMFGVLGIADADGVLAADLVLYALDQPLHLLVPVVDPARHTAGTGVEPFGPIDGRAVARHEFVAHPPLVPPRFPWRALLPPGSNYRRPPQAPMDINRILAGKGLLRMFAIRGPLERRSRMVYCRGSRYKAGMNRSFWGGEIT